VVHPASSRPMSPTVPLGLWVCSECRNSNSQTIAPSQCLVCSHWRCYACRSAGQESFEATDARSIERSRSGAGTLTSPRAPPYEDALKEKVPTDLVEARPEKSRKCGMSRNCFYLVIAIVIFLLIALGVGLGLGLTLGLKRHKCVTFLALPHIKKC